MKRQKRKVGNILEIKLKDGLYSYGIEINDIGYVAFFEYFIDSPDKYSLNNLLNSKMIYKFLISRYLVTKGNFIIKENIDIDNYNIDYSLKTEYIKDALNGKYRIYSWPEKDISTTLEYVIKNRLQCVSVFDGEEQIQRLLFSLYEKKPAITLRSEPWLDPYSGFVNNKEWMEILAKQPIRC
jgi:hypothetical protein